MSSIRAPWTAVGGQAWGHRIVRAALAGALPALAALALAGTAQASLSAAGPVNPSTRFPDWYQDSSGLRLQLCVDGPPFCLASRADLVAPEGEAFWFQAEAEIPVGSGTALLVLAQEAAFAETSPIAFGRVRIVVTGAAPNTTYTFDHPYGSATVTTDGLGNGRFNRDVGCLEVGACNWASALGTDVGPQFLRWDPAVPPQAPAGYIGDAITPHAVTGGSVRNTFGQSGGASTSLFTVQGKLAGAPFPVFRGPTAMGFGSTAPGVPVVRTIPVTSFGVPDTAGRSNLVIGQLSETGPNAPEFAIVGETCSNRTLPSGASCAVTVRFTPATPGPKSATIAIPHNAAGRVTLVALTGAGAVPAPAAAASPVRALAISGLRTTHRMSRARALRRGLRLSMRLPQGTEIVKISVLRVGRGGRVGRRPVWLGYRVVSRAGLYRVRLDSRALRRRLTAGLYQVNVTPGISRRELGRTSTTRIRITRR